MRSRGFATAIVLAAAGPLAAQSATQVVTFQVAPTSQLAVSGNPAPMVISSAVAGSAPTSVTSVGTRYAITTNEANQKISASVDRPLPSGVTLEVALEPPTGAIGAGSVVLGTASADLVTGITATAQSGLPITYRLSATPAAQVAESATRTVTFTIVSGT